MAPIFRHKLTVVDGNRYDLFAGYNAGAAQTSGDILVFIHDDVQIIGNVLSFARPIRHLTDPATGFIGGFGSKLLNERGTWWEKNQPKQQIAENCLGMVFCPSANEFSMDAAVWPGLTARFGRVLVVDGVLLMCHRRTFDRLGGFDAATYKGFHFYDVDITFRAHQLGLKNYAAPLPMLHASLGKYGDDWEINRKIFVEMHRASLPCAIVDAIPVKQG
jgi:GT2 family glycosyltransferase